MAGWQLLSLEIDKGGKDIGEFLSKELGRDIKRVSLADFLAEAEKTSDKSIDFPDHCCKQPQINSKEQIISMMKSFTGDADGPVLTVYGSGYFHHYTYGLCAAASRLSKEFCYIHIDGHTDCRHPNIEGTVMYSNFVEDLLEDKSNNAKDVIMVGSIFCEWKSLRYALFEEEMNSREALDELAAHLENTYNDVYMSCDLDVTVAKEIITDWRDWERGRLKKEQLLRMVSLIKEKKNIIGADILGFNCSPYGFESKEKFEEMRGRSRELYKCIIDEIID